MQALGKWPGHKGSSGSKGESPEKVLPPGDGEAATDPEAREGDTKGSETSPAKLPNGTMRAHPGFACNHEYGRED